MTAFFFTHIYLCDFDLRYVWLVRQCLRIQGILFDCHAMESTFTFQLDFRVIGWCMISFWKRVGFESLFPQISIKKNLILICFLFYFIFLKFSSQWKLKSHMAIRGRDLPSFVSSLEKKCHISFCLTLNLTYQCHVKTFSRKTLICYHFTWLHKN